MGRKEIFEPAMSVPAIAMRHTKIVATVGPAICFVAFCLVHMTIDSYRFGLHRTGAQHGWQHRTDQAAHGDGQRGDGQPAEQQAGCEISS